MIFLAKATLLEIHARAIEEFGGAAGILDEGALESALVAAENRYHYENADVAGCAAAYAYHLSKAHAFVDGNKRAAAAATLAFIIANDGDVDASDDELYELFIGIASGRIGRDQAESRLRKSIGTDA